MALATIGRMVGGAAVNALEFTGSRSGFSKLNSAHADAECKSHDKAIEELQAAQVHWNRKRTERLDWTNKDFRRQSHTVHTFQDADIASREYYHITGTRLKTFGPEPILADFYVPSVGQKDHGIMIIILGMGTTILIPYKLSNRNSQRVHSK